MLEVSSNSGTGPASEYKVTIRQIDLCDSTSTQAVCNNPVTVYSGNSGAIDIANTTAGSAAASLGNISSANFGVSYSFVEIIMNRAFTVKGYASPDAGAATCYTTSNEAGTAALASDGSQSSGDNASTTLFAAPAGTTTSDGNSTAFNSLTSLTDTETAGTITSGDTFFQYRQALSKTFTLKPGNIPSVKIAFGTANAVGASGNMGSDCNTNAAKVGLYAAEPDITITID